MFSMLAPRGEREEKPTKSKIAKSDKCAGHRSWRPLVLGNGERSAGARGEPAGDEGGK